MNPSESGAQQLSGPDRGGGSTNLQAHQHSGDWTPPKSASPRVNSESGAQSWAGERRAAARTHRALALRPGPVPVRTVGPRL